MSSFVIVLMVLLGHCRGYGDSGSGHVFNYCVFLYFQMARRLLVRPYIVALPVHIPNQVMMTRLIMGYGMRVTELVTGVDQLTIHLHVYADILHVDVTVYPILMVIHLSV